ncbi:hypothetical protein D0T26_28545 [Duganella sp. BJB489]|nr:hypothetical protein D0T26_28545 [Duganella sp. BJB489]
MHIWRDQALVDGLVVKKHLMLRPYRRAKAMQPVFGLGVMFRVRRSGFDRLAFLRAFRQDKRSEILDEFAFDGRCPARVIQTNQEQIEKKIGQSRRKKHVGVQDS